MQHEYSTTHNLHNFEKLRWQIWLYNFTHCQNIMNTHKHKKLLQKFNNSDNFTNCQNVMIVYWKKIHEKLDQIISQFVKTPWVNTNEKNFMTWWEIVQICY